MSKKMRTTVNANTYPTSLKVREAIASWLTAEEKALKKGSPAPSAKRFLDGWPVDQATLTNECVGLRIREDEEGVRRKGINPRFVDPAIAAFLRLCLRFQGSIGLNVVKRDDGREHFYPSITLGGCHIPLGRIVVSKSDWHNVRPIDGFYDWRARNLTGIDPRDEHKTPHQGRADLLNAAMKVYAASEKSEVRAKTYRKHLEKALMLADAREISRQRP